MNKIIESLLYIQGEKGLNSSQLKSVLEIPTKEARKYLKDFKDVYNSEEKALQVVEYNDVFKIATKEEYKKYISKLVTIFKKQKLSNSAVETIGIIAYKQPITKPQINLIRGVSSEAVVNTLLTKELIKEMGKADTPGTPTYFGVSDKFYDYFNIQSLNELPSLLSIELKEEEDEGFELYSSQRGEK